MPGRDELRVILTRFSAPEGHRPAVIHANGPGAWLQFPSPEDLEGGYQAHRAAAQRLADKMRWPGRVVGGPIRSGYAWVLLED